MTFKLASIETKLRGIDMDRRLAVFAGAVMRVGDYLETRIVEQVVHLCDLAASVGADVWPLPDECVAITMAVGVNIGRARFGDRAMVTAIFRDTGSRVLPVL
jgi:hypothetical protein